MNLRNLSTAVLALALMASAASSADPALPELKDRVSTPVHYEDQAVIISTRAGVAIVRFTDAIPEGRKYVYRFLPASEGAKEQRGQGQVFEKYIRESTQKPNEFLVENADGQLKVIAGGIQVEWLIGDPKFRHGDSKDSTHHSLVGSGARARGARRTFRSCCAQIDKRRSPNAPSSWSSRRLEPGSDNRLMASSTLFVKPDMSN